MIDHTFPWAHFDGASQENKSGGGATLFISPPHHFKIQMGLGIGTNNYVELMDVKLLLCFAIEIGCKRIHIFGDSLLMINWINKVQKCQNVFLLVLIEEIMQHLEGFDTNTCLHVYRERNTEADQLSKKGLNTLHGQWLIT